MARKKVPLKRKSATTFGSARVARIQPQPALGARQSMNVMVTFEEALKLHLAIGQGLGELNRLDRRPAEAKKACINLCIFPQDGYLTVTQDKIT